MPSVPVAIVHDYLTQQGGAERVVLALAEQFPGAPIHTSLFDPAGTFPAFATLPVVPSGLNRIAALRSHHRAALPVLAPTFSAMHIEAVVAICSSSGWAHGARVSGEKIVYCHTPARWLYQSDRYLEGSKGAVARGLDLLAPALRAWDRRAAATARTYLVNSRAVMDRVAEIYGLPAEVGPPPVEFPTEGPADPVSDLAPGFLLCVSRLLSYKNVAEVAAAVGLRPDIQLAIVGSGPLAESLTASAPKNVSVLGRVSDAQLRWLYRNCIGLVTASYEDFGLTPIEAALFAKPTAALRWGGFLDTIVEGETGVFIEAPQPLAIAEAVDTLCTTAWSKERLTRHAEQYAPARFAERMQSAVDAVR